MTISQTAVVIRTFPLFGMPQGTILSLQRPEI